MKTNKIATVTDCYGEAHSNAHIDNCMICLRHSWGKLFTCPVCSEVLTKRGIQGKTYKCLNNHGMFRVAGL